MWIFSHRAQRSRIKIPQESCTYSVTVGGIQTCNTGAEVQLAWISMSDPYLHNGRNSYIWPCRTIIASLWGLHKAMGNNLVELELPVASAGHRIQCPNSFIGLQVDFYRSLVMRRAKWNGKIFAWFEVSHPPMHKKIRKKISSGVLGDSKCVSVYLSVCPTASLSNCPSVHMWQLQSKTTFDPAVR